MTSPFSLTKIDFSFESLIIFLIPIALVISITFSGILIYGGLIFITILIITKFKKIFLPKEISDILIGFIIYIAAFLISRVHNFGLDNIFKHILRYTLDLMLFYWIFLFLYKDKKHQELITKSFYFACIISITIGLFQFFHIDLLNRQSNVERLSGFHKNPYTYAGQLSILFFFTLDKYIKNAENKILFLLPAVTYFCILNTSQRAVIISTSLTFVIYLILNHSKIHKKIKELILLLIPLSITIFFRDYFVKSFKKTIIGHENIRIKLWEKAFDLWKENPLFGTGKFPTYTYTFPVIKKTQYLHHAHNVYLHILATAGIVGFIGYASLLISFIKTIISRFSSHESKILLYIIIALSIEGLFEYFWGDSEVRYLFLVISAYYFSKIFDKEAVTN